MGKEIEKFDPSTLMQGVKDRIKATFVSLIPDTKWEEMVESEVDAFFKVEQKITIAEKAKRDGGFHSTNYQTMQLQQTPFRALVWEHCSTLTIRHLKDKVTQEYFNNTWGVSEKDLDEKMKGFIAEAAPVAMAKFFERIVFNAIGDLQNAITSGQ